MKKLNSVLFAMALTLLAVPTVWAETRTEKQQVTKAQSMRLTQDVISIDQENAKDLNSLLAQAPACPAGCRWATTCSPFGTYRCCRIIIPSQLCPTQ